MKEETHLRIGTDSLSPPAITIRLERGVQIVVSVQKGQILEVMDLPSIFNEALREVGRALGNEYFLSS